MSFPFFNMVKGTTAGTPGTGSFTPNAAATGFRAWATVPAGWIGMVRYEDGSAWELSFGYWNGTAITRLAAGFFDSSSGSPLSLTSAASAALIVDATSAQPNLGRYRTCSVHAQASSTTLQVQGFSTAGLAGTIAGASLAGTNALTRQIRVQTTSATTANAQAGLISAGPSAHYSTSAGVGGFEFTVTFGASQLPTGPRLFAGLYPGSLGGITGEPSAISFNSWAAFVKDSTDTSIQFATNGTGTGTKHADTGIAFTANGWYSATIWSPPGGGVIYGLLIRIDTGDIWFGSATTDLPTNDSFFHPIAYGSLNGTNTGTAIVMHFGHAVVRTGI